ncbi:hypothetical protein D3C80_1247590 [compost metagenome]
MVGRNVYSLAVDADRFVRNQLTGFSASSAVAHTVDDVVQTAFEQLQQVLTSSAFLAGRFFVITAELTLEHTVDTTNFLLLTQLGAVVGLTATALTVNTWGCFDVALRFQGADAAFQEQISAFTTRQFAFGTNVTSHFSLSPDYTRRFFEGRHPLCGMGVTSVMLAIL